MRLFISSLSSSSEVSNERTIYQIGGVADDSGIDNSVVINQALEDGYKILFPDTKTFYISNSILYDGTIEMEGTGTIRLAPNSLCYIIMPKTVDNEKYNILHELVDLRGLTFDADRESGNDIRDYTGTWNETFWGFGMVFSNTRSIYINDTTHWNSEAWNVCTLGNYNVESNGVDFKYSGEEAPINSDGFSGPNVMTTHNNMTADKLKDDIIGIGNGNGTLGGNELGMNYYVDVDFVHVKDVINYSYDTTSVMGMYPNTKRFDEIIIDNYETYSRYCIRIQNYWASTRPDTYVKKIVVKNCTIHLQQSNVIFDAYRLLLILNVFCEELYIENCEVIDDRQNTTLNPMVLIEDGAKECNTYIDNIFGHVKSDVTIYNGTVSTGHTYISNIHVTSDDTVTQYIGVKPVTEL